ncbi:hypothetical protein G7Y89_g15839 [Cudoniella acicularis]|uniref:F-box domain-containing protein n=1 Tax=Cudoniella acicularis TaxID=354080 RepID=A0A8H4VIZ9_9HELO|nr:hypothetical protein G7Y89_g15839 [Cudoniella acicularis]
MKLVDLPTELFLQILTSSVAIRTLKRALRLKLVSKLFARYIEEAIFLSGIVDDSPSFGWSPEFYQFFTYYHATSPRHLSSTGQVAAIYTTIRLIASQLSTENGHRNEERYTFYLSDLCLLHSKKIKGNVTKFPTPELAFQQDLFAYAAYANDLPTVTQLLKGRLDPTSCSTLFGAPLTIAGYQGHSSLLLLFLSPSVPGTPSDKKAWAAYGAVKGGHLSTLNMILSYDDESGNVSISADSGGKMRQFIYQGLQSGNLSIFKRCAELSPCTVDFSSRQFASSRTMVNAATKGHVEVFSYLLGKMGGELVERERALDGNGEGEGVAQWGLLAVA